MADIDWDDINRFFYSTIELVKPYLPSDLVTEAVHFLSHDEHEMAIEGLLLTIVGFNLGHLVDLDRAEEIARILRLDEETVFDDNFWSKFLEYKQGIRR